MIKNIFIIIVVLIFVAGAIWFFYAKYKSVDKSLNPSVSPSVSPTPSVSGSQTPSPSGAQSQYPTDKISGQEIVVGTGAVAKAGDKVTVNYVGTLLNGTKFDSSYDRKQPFSFTLGAGEVIQGWDIGVAGMKVGGKRKLIIPPQFGYGSQAIGSIPANSTLVFEVELLSIAPSK